MEYLIDNQGNSVTHNMLRINSVDKLNIAIFNNPYIKQTTVDDIMDEVFNCAYKNQYWELCGDNDKYILRFKIWKSKEDFNDFKSNIEEKIFKI